METQNITSTTYGRMLQLLLHTKHRFYATAERFGLSVMQAHALAILNGKSCPMSALGQSLGCDASNVTGIVDRLEGLGLIERTSAENDRRVKLVRLTPKGSDICAQIVQQISSAEAEELGPVLTEDEIITLNKILDKLDARNRELSSER
jgi:MarR family transcriptional regulator, organic hydroperoxide resistance regulator